MKLFTCIDHDNIFPVGVASVIVAKDRRQAKRLLDKALIAASLRPFKESEYTLQEVSIVDPIAIILRTGDY